HRRGRRRRRGQPRRLRRFGDAALPRRREPARRRPPGGRRRPRAAARRARLALAVDAARAQRHRDGPPPVIDLDTVLRFGFALALVLGLIAALAWLARRGLFGALPAVALPRRRRLAIIETAALDGRSRAVLLRRDA